MFGFLKDKLKSAVSKISKKVEEEEFIEIKEQKEEKPKEDIKKKYLEEKKEEIKKNYNLEKEKNLFKKFTTSITTRRITEEQFDSLFQDLEITLLENNTALEVVDKIKADLKLSLMERQIKRGQIEKEIKKSLRNSIQEILSSEKLDIYKLISKAKIEKRAFIILIIGYNGSGKSLTCGRLAYYLKHKGYKPVLSAADTFRASGREQTQEYGKMAEVPVVTDLKTKDSCSVIFETINHAKAKNNDIVIADTSGRIQNNKDLMDELKKISRVNNPDLTLLVEDALTGSDVVTQVEEFDKNIAIDGLILTKVDVDEKGGAFLSAVYTSKKPVLFLGYGQRINDLKEYNPEEILKNLGFNDE